MIHPDSRTLSWIQEVAGKYKFREVQLIEKTIRAFSLLEALVRSGCPLVFKGGTSLMLHLNSSRRLSIDIDIICPPGTDIEKFLGMYADEYGFGNIQLVERISRSDVPKKHAKFFYQVSFFAGRNEDKILLDVLFEDIHYNKIVTLPIASPLLKTFGDPIMVNLPSYQDLLGDKLTAFAPHTTGIPFFKGEKNCNMEINKQLYDIASLFDLINDLTISVETFKKFVAVELAYRNLPTIDIQQVLDDIFNTSLSMTIQGIGNPDEYKLLIEGMKRVRGFIHSEKYGLDSALINASKAAYLSKLIEKKITKVNHFNSNNTSELFDTEIGASLPQKLNRLKKTNIEAFYYWTEIQKLMQ
ncbi:MAG: nucleotidyl transferase AbiEii/AbiGii toxin family protein [Muribaculaceae bacterium]|nr:nucleotidyl transferase AbiEii/AbiGii toxin family protein [Muribaculaceae bacterium]